MTNRSEIEALASAVEETLYRVYEDHADYRITTTMIRDMAEAVARRLQPARVSDDPQTMPAFDAGLLGDGGGGNVDWWHEYIRALLESAHEHYVEQAGSLAAAPAPDAAECPHIYTTSNEDGSICYCNRCGTHLPTRAEAGDPECDECRGAPAPEAMEALTVDSLAMEWLEKARDVERKTANDDQATVNWATVHATQLTLRHCAADLRRLASAQQPSEFECRAFECRRKRVEMQAEIDRLRAQHEITGEVVEIGDDESGQPRIVIHTTRDEISRAGNLLFKTVSVSAGSRGEVGDD